MQSPQTEFTYQSDKVLPKADVAEKKITETDYVKKLIKNSFPRTQNFFLALSH